MSNKPRHIRDIAHLYLSQMRSTAPQSQPRQIIVSACSKECIPGFHLANLAVALSVSDYDVHIVEISGLLPDSAYFLGLPASVYVTRPDNDGSAGISALRGVTLHYSHASFSRCQQRREAEHETKNARGETLKLVHAPVFSARQAVDAGEKFRGASSELLLLDSPAAMTLPPASGLKSNRFALRVGPNAGTILNTGVTDVGVASHWKGALVDPIPAVIRDPAARLARQYMKVGEQLVNAPISQRTSYDRRASDARVRRSRAARAQTR